MNHHEIIPAWTLGTENVRLPPLGHEPVMTAERLAELRNMLTSFTQSPIVTLERHPAPTEMDQRKGIKLGATSPLAKHLSLLLSQSGHMSRAATHANAAGEGLYRMVVPANVATQVGKGLLRPMASKAIPGGVHSALVGASGIRAQATFVPATMSAASTAGAVSVGAALTVAAPLVLMAVAAGISAHAEQKRDQAISRITELLEEMRDDKLADERAELVACCDAITKATAVVLDEGRLGPSLGLDSAVHAVNKTFANSRRRLENWQSALDALSPDDPVEINALAKALPGITEPGTFDAELEIAALAIALKRRIAVLQAVDHAGRSQGNLFKNLIRALNTDQQGVDSLESGIDSFLKRLSALELKGPRYRIKPLSSGEVDRLMRSAHRIRHMGDRASFDPRPVDIAIDIVRSADGSVEVLPPESA